MNVLAISGSLRARSANSDILNAIPAWLPPGIGYTIYQGLEDLPHFSPDKDGAASPVPVQDWRAQLAAADALLICTPEYAFNLPGVLKDALDWIVSSGELTNKPVAVISASPLATGGEKALHSLLLTLRVMGAAVPGELTLSIPFIKKKLDDTGMVTDAETRQQLQDLLQRLIALAATKNDSGQD